MNDDALDFAREDLLLIVADLSAGPQVLYASLPEVEGVPRSDEVATELRIRERA